MQKIAFDPANPRDALDELPGKAAVFALYGADDGAEPYIGRTPNLRGRLERLLTPSAKHPKRLQLAGRVRRILWRLSGSEFESLLVQFSWLEKIYGAKALERMHLRTPALVRFLGSNPYPRVMVTNRLVQRESEWTYGPFASRVAAERYVEEMLKLFLLRRCTEELEPDPGNPGCIYSEMKMCLAPCYKGCTDERYAEEAAGVAAFLATRGESRLVPLRSSRDAASANLDFESAAALHAQVQRIEAVRALAPELVRPLSRLRVAILQAAANAGEVAVFLFEQGSLSGPVGFSTAGMKIQNEAAPSGEIAIQQAEPDSAAVPDAPAETESKIARGALEARMEATLNALRGECNAHSATLRQGHMALLKRWYYRPEIRRQGEIFFPAEDGRWPLKAMVRGAGRVAAKVLGPVNAEEPPSR
jgi:excinuclease UvrABC nuclease subunit